MGSLRIPLWLRLVFLSLTQFEFRLGCFALKCPLIIFLLLIPLVVLLWPGLAPFGLFQFWGWWGSPLDLVLLFASMVAVGGLVTLLSTPRILRQADTVLVYTRDWLFPRLLQAGPLEELVYRWLFFYGALICLPALNFITFGLVSWLYAAFLGPLADLFTLHQLHNYLFSNQYGWVVGMAVICTNGGFRDDHSYKGLVGWIWAWFAGMWLFLIMFRHGLFAAMLVHSTYNLCVLALTWLIARLRMTPAEARLRIQEKLALQQAWLTQLSGREEV